MLPAPSIDDLADRMCRRAGNGPDRGRGPFILFLGEGVSRAAGAPARAEIARAALRTYGFEAETSSWPAEAVLDKFAAHTSSLSRPQFARMLRSLYAKVPVPSFYQDLATLVRLGYFPLIVTTNFDTLLEQALANAGLRSSDLRVTTFGTERRSPGAAEGDRPPATHIVKLHGDLAQDTAHVTPDQIEGALRSSSQWVKADLRGDMIMMGHLPSEDPVDRWLTHGSHRELWWIGAEEPGDAARTRIASWSSDLQWIVGDLGRPFVFLGQLALRLRSRATQWATPPVPPGRESAAPAPEPPQAVEPPLVDGAGTEDLAATLNREILRTQSVLYNLDQETTAGERPPQLEAQILYQKKQIVRLEDRVHSLPEIQKEVLDIVRRIRDSVQQPRPDDESTFGPLVAFLGTQLDTLSGELGKSSPNQILVSAAIGATLMVADRLCTEYGAEVVRPEEVRRLAALVPTAAGKVVL